jgi:hypothetical protein
MQKNKKFMQVHAGSCLSQEVTDLSVGSPSRHSFVIMRSKFLHAIHKGEKSSRSNYYTTKIFITSYF